MRLVDLAEQHPSGRLSGMVYPAQVDTCTAELLRDAHAWAAERRLPFQIHAAQSVTEFHEMQRRHGMSSVQYLDSLGVLGEHAILGHAIFLDHHPWLHWTTREDLALLAERGVSVAHCPTVFARRGIALRTLGQYRRSGVNIGIGTDTYPHHFLEEIRAALAETPTYPIRRLNSKPSSRPNASRLPSVKPRSQRAKPSSRPNASRRSW